MFYTFRYGNTQPAYLGPRFVSIFRLIFIIIGVHSVQSGTYWMYIQNLVLCLFVYFVCLNVCFVSSTNKAAEYFPYCFM